MFYKITIVILIFVTNTSCRTSSSQKYKAQSINTLTEEGDAFENCDSVDPLRSLCTKILETSQLSHNFNIPPQTSSVFLEISSNKGIRSSPSSFQDIDSLTSPGGLIIYDNDLSYLENINPRSLDDTAALFTMLIPNHERPAAETNKKLTQSNLAGNWTFNSIGEPAPDSVKVRYRIREHFQKAKLQLKIFLTGANRNSRQMPEIWDLMNISSPSSASKENFKIFSNELERIFCQANIDLDIIEVKDIEIPDGLGYPEGFRYVSLVPQIDKASLKELMTAVLDQSKSEDGILHLTLIDGFVFSDGWIGWSWSPGPYESETLLSGMIVAMGDESPISIASVAAHEIGHFLGLYHVKELGEDLPDPLEDTDSNNSDNLMYPSNHGTSFSVGQIDIMKRHPNIIPVAENDSSFNCGP
ncbi:MAG: hypothetical protein KBD78_00290 [Oligoflexales bacterium]|nr:hypothetical protein [Oligoflexales bacterium]